MTSIDGLSQHIIIMVYMHWIVLLIHAKTNMISVRVYK